MEIAYIAENSIRLKGKQVTLFIGLPSGKSKGLGDAYLLVGTEKTSQFFVENGIVFEGPGEYEVKGTKITGFAIGGEVMYTISLDGMSILVANVSATPTAKDKLHEHDVALLMSDDTLSQSIMGIIDASVFLFAGAKNEDNAKAFGKELVTVGKYNVTKEKLPQEKEFVFFSQGL